MATRRSPGDWTSSTNVMVPDLYTIACTGPWSSVAVVLLNRARTRTATVAVHCLHVLRHRWARATPAGCAAVEHEPAADPPQSHHRPDPQHPQPQPPHASPLPAQPPAEPRAHAWSHRHWLILVPHVDSSSDPLPSSACSFTTSRSSSDATPRCSARYILRTYSQQSCTASMIRSNISSRRSQPAAARAVAVVRRRVPSPPRGALPTPRCEGGERTELSAPSRRTSSGGRSKPRTARCPSGAGARPCPIEGTWLACCSGGSLPSSSHPLAVAFKATSRRQRLRRLLEAQAGPGCPSRSTARRW